MTKFSVLSLWHDVFCLPNLKFGATDSISIPPLSYLSQHKLERFLAMIAFPFRYRSLFPRTRAKICFAATWISRLLETGIFLGLNFVFIMNILAFFTLSPYIYILSITLEHERKIVSLQVLYPDHKRWDNFWQPLNLPTTSSEKTVSGLSIKVNASFLICLQFSVTTFVGEIGCRTRHDVQKFRF